MENTAYQFEIIYILYEGIFVCKMVLYLNDKQVNYKGVVDDVHQIDRRC